MLCVNPQSVWFADVLLANVRLIAVERRAGSVVAAWADTAPGVMFCDAVQVRTTLKVVQELLTGDAESLMTAPVPGEQDEFRFTAAAQNARAPKVFSARACVVGVTYELPPGPLVSSGSAAKVAVRTISFELTSPTGAANALIAME